MKLVVNGRFISRRMTGVDRFALEVLRAVAGLKANEDGVVAGIDAEILLALEQSSADLDIGIPVRRAGRFSGQLWEQIDLPRYRDAGALMLSLCNTAPVFGRRQVVVVHDAATVAFPSAFSVAFRWWYRFLIPILGRTAKKILTVSEFSANEIASKFGIPSEKISVVVEGGEHILRVDPDANAVIRFGLTERPFVLAVSSMAAHKNFRLVLEALSELQDPPFDVAIAGGSNSRVFGAAGALKSERIKWLGYVSDAELRALYESASCFVFPSLYEGFGIPPLEAMNCGCPVLAANAASIPEVCGDAALYFDPNDASQLAALLMRVTREASLRAELTARGYERARRFSWENAARQVLQACREVA